MRKFFDSLLSVFLSLVLTASLVPSVALAEAVETITGSSDDEQSQVESVESSSDSKSVENNGDGSASTSDTKPVEEKVEVSESSGNVSYEVDTELVEVEPVKVKLVFNGNYEGFDTSLMSDMEVVLDGSEVLLPRNSFVREGFNFIGWSTTFDNKPIADNSDTTDVDESFAAFMMLDEQPLLDLRFVDQDNNEHDLSSCVRDGRLTLFAQWEAIPEPMVENKPVEQVSEDNVNADVNKSDKTDEELKSDDKTDVKDENKSDEKLNTSEGSDVDSSEVIDKTDDRNQTETVEDSSEKTDGSDVDENKVEEKSDDAESKDKEDVASVSENKDKVETEKPVVKDDGAIVDSPVTTVTNEREYQYRLIVGGITVKQVLESDVVLGETDGTFLLGFDNSADMMSARLRYAQFAEFVSIDMSVGAAAGESVDDQSMTVTDNPFTALENATDVTVSAKTPVVALLDTGAPAGVTGVSMLGDDVSDKSGHAALMLEAMREQNPDVQVLSVKVLDDAGHGTASSLYAGIMYAVEHDADIINFSLAGADNEGNAAIREAVQYALDHGVIVIAAAGNGGYDASLVTPANIDGVFTVGAADENGILDGSNRGDCVDIYVKASSTSVASAKVSGQASIGLDGWRERVVEKLGVKVDASDGAADEPVGEGVDASWERAPYVYAVLDSSGNMTFFKSNNEYSAGTGQTVTDIDGNSYTGQVYRGFVNTVYTYYANVPWYSQRTSINTVTFAQVIAPKSTAYWFYGCTNLSTFDVECRLDVSSIKDISYMFYGCSNAAFNPNVSQWDISSVSSMQCLFYNCYGASFNPDVSLWNTSAVTNMSFVFCGCYGAAFNPDVSSWDTSAVTDIQCLFDGCHGAAFNPDVSDFDMSHVLDMHQMFYGCYGAAFSPDVSSWNTSAVTDMSYVFYNCHGADFNPDVSDWDTSSATAMNSMFSQCYGAVFNPDVSNWDTSSVTTMSYMFSNCRGAAFNPDVSGWDTSSVTDMKEMFSQCYGNAFKPDVSEWDTSHVTNMYRMFYKCYGNGFTSLDLSGWDVSSVTNMNDMFNGSYRLVTIYVVSDTDWSTQVLLTSSSSMFYGCSRLVGGNGTRYASSIVDKSYARVDGLNGTPGYFTAKSGVGVVSSKVYAVLDSSGTLTFFKSNNMYAAGTGMTVTDVDGNSYTGQVYSGFMDTIFTSASSVPWYSQRASINTVTFAQVISPKVTAYWFYNLSNLSTFDAEGRLDVSSVINMTYMFGFCSNASFNPDVSSWDTSSVVDMNHMFASCYGAIFNPDVSNWDVSHVIDMSSMFNGCYGAAFNPNVASWDISSVTTMSYMFNNCYGSSFNPDLSLWNTSNVTNMSSVFYQCRGAIFNPNVSNWDVSHVTTMYQMFYGCYGNAFNPDVSDWDTSSVTSMGLMFYNCYGTAFDPDVSGWDVSNVISMSSMFNGCSGASFSPDVSLWDVSSVVSMQSMFDSCYGAAFTSIDLSRWNTCSVTNMGYMFRGCSRLKQVVLGENFLFRDYWATSSTEGVLATPSSVIPYTGKWINSSVAGANPVTSAQLTANYDGRQTTGDYARGIYVWDSVPAVFFEANGGSGSMNPVALGSGTTAPTCTFTVPNGMRFVSWNTAADGSGVTYAVGDALPTSVSVTLYAQWESDPFVGRAYAVLDSDGTLTFFRSTSSYYGTSSQTVTDFLGNSYTGQVYSGFETANPYTYYTSVPWYNQFSSIRNVTIADGQAIKPNGTAYWFYGCSNLESFSNAENLDMSSVTSMYEMFYNCCNVAFNLDVSSWNTSNVTNMSYAFTNCYGDSFNPDVSDWDTSKVTNMSYMFYGCHGAVFNPDVSDWDTSRVTNMRNMFYNCYNNNFNPDISSWNTSSVTNMSYMFYGCYGNVFNPDISNWDTSSVINMSYMFYNCYGNNFNLNMNNWDTSKVTNMSYMFYNCYGAVFNPNVSNWDTSSVTNMSYMFYNCRDAVFNPDVSNWDTSGVTTMNNMFYGCYGDAFNPDVSDWDTSGVTTMGSMFNNCHNVIFNPDVSGWDTSSVTSFGSMFSNCYGAAFNPDVSNFDMSSATSINSMFNNCRGNSFDPDVSNWDTSSVTNMGWTFSNCYGAAFNPDVSNWNTSSVTNMSSMFEKCYGASFTKLDISGWDFSSITSSSNYLGLQNCRNLKTLVVSSDSLINTTFYEHSAQGIYKATWKNDSQSIAGSTAANMISTINAGNGAGTWEWELVGTAYAVLDSNGLFTFFRSENSYSAGANQTVTDIAGNSYTGEVYTGFETVNPYTYYGSVPWYNQRLSIQSVTIANDQVIKPKGTAYWFYECSNLGAFTNAGNLDVSNVTNMSSMFMSCSGAAFNPDVSNWNTSSVTDMREMFRYCCGAAFNPNVSSWDTSKVTNMGYMFSGCYGAAFTSLDVSDWDFSKITGASDYLGLQYCNNLKELKVSAASKIAEVSEHQAQGSYLSTWGNTDRGITGSTAVDMVSTINAGNGAGTWEWELSGYTVILRAPSGLGLSDVIQTVRADDNWSVPANSFTYNLHDFVEWSGSDGNMYDPNDVITGGTFASGDTLVLSAVFTPHEYAGTLDPDNSDDNNDGYGDNISFSAPASMNYVVRADGSLIGASNASIQNHGDFNIKVSSLDIDATSPFSIVRSAGTQANAVDLVLGPANNTVEAVDYLNKSGVPDVTALRVPAKSGSTPGSLVLTSSGHVGPLSVNLGSAVKFAEAQWCVKVVD